MKQVIPINATKDGIAPTITSHYYKAGGGDFIPRILNEPSRHLAILEIEMKEPEIQKIGSYVPNSRCAGIIVASNGIAPTVMENHGMVTAVIEPCILGYTRDNKGNVQNYHEREIAGTLHTSSGQGGNTDQLVKETRYRIRKLTPTECLRLMGVDDSDIEKMKSAKIMQTLKNGKVKERPMPKTQLYKMAGNSIVVDVLYHIFYQMFIVEPPKPKPTQLSLFD